MKIPGKNFLSNALLRKPASNSKIGLAPGSLVFTGEKKLDSPEVAIVKYSEDQWEEIVFDPKTILDAGEEFVLWYDVRGIHDVNLIEQIGTKFQVHSLALEDVLDVNQRPKFDEYTGGFFIVLKCFKFDQEMMSIQAEQISVYCGKNFVLSFQENADDAFIGVRQRISTNGSKIRKRGADYIAYALIDNIVDQYFGAIDGIENAISQIEEEILENPERETKSKIHTIKRELLTLRKSISPLREAVSRFSRSDHDLIQATTPMYIRDLYDHTIQVMDMIETYRDTLSGLHDLYISELSFKMNAVMQVLTIIATIFIPLTFLAGIYGMNFENMPELNYKYGYHVLLGLMALVTLLLIIFFRKKHWL